MTFAEYDEAYVKHLNGKHTPDDPPLLPDDARVWPVEHPEARPHGAPREDPPRDHDARARRSRLGKEVLGRKRRAGCLVMDICAETLAYRLDIPPAILFDRHVPIRIDFRQTCNLSSNNEIQDRSCTNLLMIAKHNYHHTVGFVGSTVDSGGGDPYPHGVN